MPIDVIDTRNQPKRYRIVNNTKQVWELETVAKGKEPRTRLTLGSTEDAGKDPKLVTLPDQVVDGDLWRELRKQKIVRGMLDKGTIYEYSLG